MTITAPKQSNLVNQTTSSEHTAEDQKHHLSEALAILAISIQILYSSLSYSYLHNNRKWLGEEDLV